MILVRDIFQLKFGKAKEAMEILKRDFTNSSQMKNFPDRLLTDLTGQYYTLVMESTYNDMADYENSMHEMSPSDEWRKAYQKFTELVDWGKREIFTIVPVEQGTTQQKAEAMAQAGRGR